MFIIEKEFLWLMLIEGMNYKLYRKIINVFFSVSKIYEISKDKELFQKIIYSNKIFIPTNIYLRFISNELKIKAELIYNNLLNQNIYTIPIISKNYPRNLINTYNPPLAIFVYGNILSVINDKKVIYLYNDNLSKFGQKVYKYFNYYINNKMLKIGENLEADILIKYENIFDINYLNSIDNNRIIVPYNNLNEKLEMILGITDYLLIIEARYNEYTKNMVNVVIANGKEILVVPGNIFNKNHYFSNYLIQEGATVLLNKRDLDKFM